LKRVREAEEGEVDFFSQTRCDLVAHGKNARKKHLFLSKQFPLAEIFFCRFACLSGLMGWEQMHGQTVQLGNNFRGLNTKITAAKKYTKLPLGQAHRDAYLLFACLP
jgi:hypothetical protein